MAKTDRIVCGRRSAFTLLELVIVMLILAILSALAVVSFRSVIDRQQMMLAIESFRRFDAQARREARLQGTTIPVAIDRGRGQLRWGSGTRNRVFRLPRQIEIAELRASADRATAGNLSRAGSRSITSSTAGLYYAADGSSPTYALKLARGDLQRWFVVLGLSGQVVPCDREEQVDAIFRL